MARIENIVVLGGGSAGLLAALTLKRMVPALKVRVVRSPEIGVIGVGEGTTSAFPRHLFENLQLKPRDFYLQAEPTWKLGLRFLWGPRKEFYYTFGREIAAKWPTLTHSVGYYCDGDDDAVVGPISSMMAHGRVFARQPNGVPQIHNAHAFHIENKKLVAWLENICRHFGVIIDDGTMREAERREDGISALLLESGERVPADLFIDASGFRSELLGHTLGVPYRSYSDSLFCDRAVIGGWPRTDETVWPYTTAETMDSGWCWQIEHEHFINRGYVYSSQFISDDAALAEFLQKNPKVATEPRLVKFRSGRYETMWTGNVVGVGNASGFVEPLEATALQVIVVQCSTLVDSLIESERDPTPTLRMVYNRFNGQQWDNIRDFLSLHYAFNTRIDTPFWQHCRAETALGGAREFVDYYRENGPGLVTGDAFMDPRNHFGLEGYYAMLVGQHVPHGRPYRPSDVEAKAWRDGRMRLHEQAKRGMTVPEALAAVRKPGMVWK
ncbi:MAG: tryptophan 7-halogenase [Verrucomicrobiales bacterium]